MRTYYWIPSLITLLTFLALLLPAGLAHADVSSGTVITVNSAVDDELNGTCSLREAIQAANTDSAVDACPAGDGADTILLGAEIYQLSIKGTGEEYAQTGDLDIREDLVIRGQGMNSTVVDDGGIDRVFHIYWTDPHPVVHFEHLTIQNGNVTKDLYGGGGILNEYGTITFQAVSLENNHSIYDGVGSAVGGGMDNLGTATLINSYVSNNGADDGGGIFNSGTLSIYRSTLNNNTATLDEGGALDNYGGTVTLEDVTISGNIALSGSGGGIFSDGTLFISNTTISGNTASINGGALYNASDATLQNVTISGNSAASGGGIYNTGHLDITNSTIVENSAISAEPPNGANIDNEDTVTIENTIIALGQIAPNCAGLAGLTSLGHNLEDANTCNLDHADDHPGVGDPSIDVLANRGGPTWTHALNSSSPAIDTGNDDTCPSTDQRGANRAGEYCDIGAYEYDGEFSIENVFLPLITR